MAPLAPHEAACAAMMLQVLRNHCDTHWLSLPVVLNCCGYLLAMIGGRWCAAGVPLDRVLQRLAEDLTRDLRTRPNETPLLLLAKEGLAECSWEMIGDRMCALGDALLALFNDAAGEAPGISAEGGWHIFVGLAVEVLAAMPAQYGFTLDEVDTFMTRSLLPAIATGITRERAR